MKLLKQLAEDSCTSLYLMCNQKSQKLSDIHLYLDSCISRSLMYNAYLNWFRSIRSSARLDSYQVFSFSYTLNMSSLQMEKKYQNMLDTRSKLAHRANPKIPLSKVKKIWLI